jgi:hypothetical protein
MNQFQIAFGDGIGVFADLRRKKPLLPCGGLWTKPNCHRTVRVLLDVRQGTINTGKPTPYTTSWLGQAMTRSAGPSAAWTVGYRTNAGTASPNAVTRPMASSEFHGPENENAEKG